MILIKNIEVYAPEKIGEKDVLITGNKIYKISNEISLNTNLKIKVIDGKNKILIPGFIDSHVHILGGGGEGGYKTRTPEITLTDLTKHGITTVIGCLGTDGTTRTMSNLIAKAKGLKEEGISCYIYTGSYQFPVKTLTQNIQDDIILIEEIIGVGELALSDHRSSHPSIEDLVKVASQARVGGILSNKAGIINIHLGDGKENFSKILQVVENTEIPITQFLPTHCTRNPKVFEEALKYAKKGGYIDFTTSTTHKFLENGETKCSKALKITLEKNIPIENITFTSDGQGSLPKFDSKGNFIGLDIGKSSSLYEEVKNAIIKENIPIEKAIKVITENPAKILKLKNKGTIEEQKDADIVILDKDLEINTVISMGKIMIENKKIKVKNTFI
ncbi:beta-aspartyl-dipeptidase (metallo-type) [Oceanotoga teriensis]|uniref:Isoaspartyl dipeptidase n=1 Tax=Oceanotoga teriensis TaxID=515440 RepID=A0AA45HHR9_9BACT|nr:beta-aspartyl-peptidase [Oceanotoga teriensis]PWJ88246.1 beta-aspartyl-dipeptidase (metallo-type) [Oceanotoga teriensis]